MKHMLRLALLLSLTSLSLLSVPAASAGSVTITGTLDAGDPTMPVVFISTPNCTGQGVSPVHYEATTFAVDAGGTYLITLTSTGTTPGFASMYLYAGSFDPNNGVANCVAGSNIADPHNLTYPLTAGTTYILVVFDDQFAQPGGTYTATISGPGTIYLGGVPVAGCDAYVQIPATAVGGQFVANAQVYWRPGELATPVITIEAGKNYLVAGQDATGQFRKVLISCEWVWVQANTVGPNPEPPWNGAPLPGNVVE